MIKKIQNLIEDNTSMDVTHNQVIMGVAVLGTLLLLIIILMFGAGGPKKNPDYISTPPTGGPTYNQ